MITSIVVQNEFPLRVGEILRVTLPPLSSVEEITVLPGAEKVGKDHISYPTKSRVITPGTNKSHVSTRNMERIHRYAPIRDFYYKD